MKTPIRYLAIALFYTAFLISPFGCAHVPRSKPPTLSEQVKVELGTIGVVPACFQPETNFLRPLGKGEAAGAGAMAGATGALYAIAQNPVIIIVPYAIPIAIGAGMVIGTGVGAVLGVTDSKKKEAESVLTVALTEFNVQEWVAGNLLSIAKEKTHYQLVLLKEIGPVLLDQGIQYDSPSIKGVHTVLETSVRKCGLWGEKGINPPLHFFMTVTTRVIRLSDNVELYNHTFRYEGKSQKFVKWAANNGQPFREEFELCCRTLAKEIVETLFLGDQRPEIKK